MITGEGIDVSYAQDIRDPRALLADVSGGYVWVKVWDADDQRPIKLEQVPLLRDAGFAVGGYGFFRDVPAAEQVAGFMRALEQTDARDIKPMLDLEPIDIGRWGFRNDVVGAARASAVGRHVHQVMQWNGYDPVTYSGESFMKLMKINLWGFPVKPVVANYSRVPQIFHVGHQYTSSDQPPGLAPGGRIDRDRVSIDISAWKGEPMAWRVANSLNQLLKQLNAMAPNRNKVSDGAIGDTAHSNRTSDHNPWYGPGIVTARDFTHDPRGGLDCQWLADRLVRGGDGRIKYIIWNGRIWNRSSGWQQYYGPNPHTKHLHLSVVASPACDHSTPWNLGVTGGGGGAPAPGPATPAYTTEDYMASLPASNGKFRSVTSVIPSGSKVAALSIGYVPIKMTHLKFLDVAGNEVKGSKGEAVIPPAKPYTVTVPDGALTAEVAYSIEGDQHDGSLGFRPTW